MAGKDKHLKEMLDQDLPTEGYSFDELAKGIATGTLSRRQVLKFVGAAALGSVLSSALPAAAVARKKKKKKCPPGTVRKKKRKKVKCVPLPPQMCTAGDAAACTSCGTSPTTGNSCSCVPSNLGNPTCIDTKKGTFPSCASDNDCPTGSICIEEFTCGKPPGTFACAFPCGS